MDQNHLTIKTYMAIMAERDAAIRERNMALDERKRAFAERDMAMLQRDAALAERNAAIGERDKAMAALRFWDSSMNGNSMAPDSPGNEMTHGAKHIHYQQQMHHMPHLQEDGQYSKEIHTTEAFQVTELASETAKPRKGKQTKETKGTSTKKSSKSSGKGKRGSEGLSEEDVTANIWKNEQDLVDGDGDGDGDDDVDRQLMWNDDSGLNQVDFDESSMPVPVCSCTGVPQPCYKWGNGGYQSACCTTTMSMYPLPQVSNKRYSRVGGRKMSGSAFTKLLSRLVAEGHDLSNPLDLKDHWARHGTNRYSTQK